MLYKCIQTLWVKESLPTRCLPTHLLKLKQCDLRSVGFEFYCRQVFLQSFCTSNWKFLYNKWALFEKTITHNWSLCSSICSVLIWEIVLSRKEDGQRPFSEEEAQSSPTHFGARIHLRPRRGLYLQACVTSLQHEVYSFCKSFHLFQCLPHREFHLFPLVVVETLTIFYICPDLYRHRTWSTYHFVETLLYESPFISHRLFHALPCCNDL